MDPKTGALARRRPQLRHPHRPQLRRQLQFHYAPTRSQIGPDPNILKLLQVAAWRPIPTLAGDGLNTGAYAWNPPARKWRLQSPGRIDHNFNVNHAIFGTLPARSTHDTLGGDPNNCRPQVLPGLPAAGEVFRSSHNAAVQLRAGHLRRAWSTN